MEPFDKEAAYDRLHTNSECVNIFERYIKKGATPETVDRLQEALINIPWEWDKISTETVEQTVERRGALASKIREVCLMMENDPDANKLRVVDAKNIATDTFVKLDNWPYVHDYFREISEHLEALPIASIRNEWEELKPIQGSKKIPIVVHYAKRRVFDLLCGLPGVDFGRAPNADTATLINILFNLSPDERLVGDDISQMRKDERRKYEIE